MPLIFLTPCLPRCVVIALCAGCALVLSACGNSGGVNVAQTDKGSISIDKQQVLSIRPSGQPTATVDAAQHLRIAGKAVTLDPDQQAAVDAYYNQALNIRSHSAGMGQDGIEMAKGVFSSLARGDINALGKDARSDVRQMLGRLKPLCVALGATYDAQSRLVSTVEAFRPYAVIEQQQVANCRDKLASQRAKRQATQSDNQTAN